MLLLLAILILVLGVPMLLSAYAMALGIMVSSTSEGKAALLFFIFPGAVYVVVYAILGALCGLRFWSVFTEDSPLKSIRDVWRDDAGLAAVATIEFIVIWAVAWWAIGSLYRD